MTPQLSITRLINEVDEPLGFFASKASCDSNPGWGMYQGANVRDGLLHRHVHRTDVIIEGGR